jgi:glycosyltransferase involved in cell wall biosynthesis
VGLGSIIASCPPIATPKYFSNTSQSTLGHTAQRMKISVIIPTLREAARIEALLQALENQQHDAVEIIVVDGGSDDGTLRLVQQHTKVLCLEQTPPGTSRQRNAGAQLATGELLVFMDADNLPHPQFLRDVANSFRRWPFAVACPWFIARESLTIRAIYWGFNVLFWLGQSWLRTGSGVCIITPRHVWKSVGGFREDLHLGEDIDFIRRAARRGWHRHLWVPLETSGRRFQRDGVWQLIKFYMRISPLILSGRYERLKSIPYPSAPYDKNMKP